MRADFKVVLDACVLANYGVANLLLLLAEKPRLYLPVWSDEILAETRRTQVGKLGWEERLADRFQSQLRSQFPESLVTDYEYRVVDCGNDPKDRHVLAVENLRGVVTVRTEQSPQLGREVLIELKPHAATASGVGTTRSRASSAA